MQRQAVWSVAVALLLAAGEVFAQASPFSTGAAAFQGSFLAILTPVAVIAVMALGRPPGSTGSAGRGRSPASPASCWCSARRRSWRGSAECSACERDVAIERNAGVTADPLFVGVTRPAMAFGVTYSALLVNAVVTVELFLLTRNLLWLLVCVPVHGVFWLLCLSEPRFFDLAVLWGRTRGPGLFGNGRCGGRRAYSALALDLPDRAGRRRASPWCVAA